MTLGILAARPDHQEDSLNTSQLVNNGRAGRGEGLYGYRLKSSPPIPHNMSLFRNSVTANVINTQRSCWNRLRSRSNMASVLIRKERGTQEESSHTS
jgi:hypothetical protein